MSEAAKKRVEYALIAAMMVMIAWCAFAPDASFAAPADTEPVTSSNGSWRRVQELGVFGTDTGVFPRYISDTPEAHWVRDVIRNKPDRAERREMREVIAGHGQLPHEDVEESEIAGARVRRRYVWETFIAPNGQIAERCIDIDETVEIY